MSFTCGTFLNKQGQDVMILEWGVIWSANQPYTGKPGDVQISLYFLIITILCICMCVLIYLLHLELCHNKCWDPSRSSPLGSFRWTDLPPALSTNRRTNEKPLLVSSSCLAAFSHLHFYKLIVHANAASCPSNIL